MGPIALFDKSFLQSLSTDESVWFDHFFYSVIAPVFYIETLADLEKKSRKGKTPEEEVGIIAAKTPEMSGAPCLYHQRLVIENLRGAPVPMTGQIPAAQTRHVVKDGKLGAIIEETSEARAFARWQRGRFNDVERDHARAWRAQLESLDLEAVQEAMRKVGINAKTCRDGAAAKALAEQFVVALTKSPGRFDIALHLLGVPERLHRQIKDRWRATKRQPLSTFAPYAAYVLTVEMFFKISLGAGLIAATRASNRVDIAYLFYLPFCHFFVSTDRLHLLTAPLFLREGQRFVRGSELKADLSSLDALYKTLPEQVRTTGIYKFAHRLPEASHGIVRELTAQFAPGLLKPVVEGDPTNIKPEFHSKMAADVRGWIDAPAAKAASMSEDYEAMVIQRSISRQRGSWLQIGPEVKDDV